VIPRRPPALAAVSVLVLVEAAAVAGLAVAFVADLLRGGVELPAATVFLVVFLLGVAAVLVACVRGFARGRRWARSPVLTWQLLLGVMAVGWFGAEPSVWVAGVLVVAVLVVVGLLLPSVVAVTSGRAAPQAPST
jgi:hypothetical protein